MKAEGTTPCCSTPDLTTYDPRTTSHQSPVTPYQSRVTSLKGGSMADRNVEVALNRFTWRMLSQYVSPWEFEQLKKKIQVWDHTHYLKEMAWP